MLRLAECRLRRDEGIAGLAERLGIARIEARIGENPVEPCDLGFETSDLPRQGFERVLLPEGEPLPRRRRRRRLWNCGGFFGARRFRGSFRGEDTEAALRHMVQAAQEVRERLLEEAALA